MRHQINKIILKSGKGAKDMAVRKLVTNFLKNGKLKTTITKSKILKSQVDSLVSTARIKTEATKNTVLKRIGRWEIMNLLFNDIVPALKSKNGGFVKTTKLGQRASDGTMMVMCEWAAPVVYNTKEKIIKESKSVTAKKETKKIEKKVDKK